MAIGYLVLTLAYYHNSFNGANLPWMSTSLFGLDGESYNQTAILTPQNTLDPSKLADVGLPRYTTTYAISQMCYNFSLGAAITHVLIWNWAELKAAFGSMRFLHSSQDIDDPHYQGTLIFSTEVAMITDLWHSVEMKKYPEVPQWWYGCVFLASLAIGIGCSVRLSSISFQLPLTLAYL